MTSVPYSALTKEQLMQVDYLFADHVFGTDASAYLYELDKSGKVTRRECQRLAVKDTKRITEVTFHPIADPQLTQEQIETAKMHMDALAVSIAERLYKQQLEEVTT